MSYHINNLENISKFMHNFNSLCRVAMNTLRVKYRGKSNATKAALENGFTLADDGYFYPTANILNKNQKIPDYPETTKDVEVPLSFKSSINKTIIVTSYLIGTDVPEHIWLSLTELVVYLEAELVIIAHRYQNPTTLENSIKRIEKAEYIDPKVLPFLAWKDFSVHNHDIRCSVQINCTTLNPLPQLKKIVTSHSIFGHSMQNMKPVPSMGEKPLVCWTTGTISDIDTARNLKASVAQFHFKFGCIIIEPDCSSRNVHFTKSGLWTDLDAIWDGKTVKCTTSGDYKHVIWGDYHHGQTCPEALNYFTMITKRLSPDYLVLHDFIDGMTVNPHATRGEQTLIWANLYQEFQSCVYELKRLKKDIEIDILLVKSNHNDMISRYFKKTAFQDLDFQERRLLKSWLESDYSPEMMLLNEVEGTYIADDCYNVGNLRIDNHGDSGINGSKGSLEQFFSNGIIGVTGHSHTPGILGGCVAVGTMTKLRLSYNQKGASSWMNSIASVNRYGKVQSLLMF